MPSIYLYGFMDAPEDCEIPLPALGIADMPVRALCRGEIGALVSDLSSTELSIDPENLLAHERVLEASLAQHTVLPAAFGSVAASLEDVLSLLATHHETLKEELNRLRDRVEVGLKVYWNRDALVRELETITGGLDERRRKAQSDPALEHALAIEVGQKVEALMDAWRGRYEVAVFQRLRAHADDMCLNDPIGPRMLWNAAFLVPRKQEVWFRKEAGRLTERFKDRFELRYAGPLPPHNFVRLHLS